MIEDFELPIKITEMIRIAYTKSSLLDFLLEEK